MTYRFDILRIVAKYNKQLLVITANHRLELAIATNKMQLLLITSNFHL